MSAPVSRCVFLHDATLDQGGYPEACPFNTRRAGKTRKTLLSMGLLPGRDRVEVAPSRLTRSDLETFHSPRYLDILQVAGDPARLGPDALSAGLGTPDCPVFPGMYDYITLAAGASVTGARLLLQGEATVAFNPSGGFHHAGPDYASGFCYLNDVVLAALEGTRAGRRVLFLDLDVHHCDGVQNAFYRRNDVMTISLHESGHTLFPGTGFENEIGEGEGRGFSVNVPLPVGTYDSIYLDVFRTVVLPLIRSFNPDLLIVELGMDGLAGDPLAHLHLTNNVYADIVKQLVQLGKPILATGGGGYHVENTVRGWALAWSILCGEEPEDLSIGMGGVMLENTDWFGGLRDRVLLTDAGQRGHVDEEVRQVIDRIRKTVFPIHGIA
jgi:acetoin utilization protein AcuC